MPEFDFNEGYARLAAAMTTGSDDIPFIAQMHEFSMKSKGVPGRAFYTDPETFVRGILETTRDFGFDTPSLIWDAYNIEAEALGANLVLFDDMAPAIDNVEPIIQSESDLARLPSPDPYGAGRMPFVMEVLRLVQELTGQPPGPCYCAPFTLAVQCMTFERLILAIKDDPAYVHKVLTFLTDEVLAPYLNALVREFPEATVLDGSDATASLPFITQDMLEEFSLQYIQRLQGLCDRPVICDNWWGDSFSDNREAFWETKLLATPDYFKIQDPDLFKVGAQPAVDFALAKDLPIVMGADNNVLQRGPAEDIWQRIHEYMEIGGQSRKLVIYLCSLSAQTPVEHVRSAIAAVKAYRTGERPHEGLRLSGADDAPVTMAQPGDFRARISTGGSREETEQLLDDIYNGVLDFADEDVAALVRRGLDDELGTLAGVVHSRNASDEPEGLVSLSLSHLSPVDPLLEVDADSRKPALDGLGVHVEELHLDALHSENLSDPVSHGAGAEDGCSLDVVRVHRSRITERGLKSRG